MKNYQTGDVRNVCLVGAQGDGKTSLAEALLFNAGVTNRLGRVEDGSTVCDYTEDEIERRISIGLCVACMEHGTTKVNLLTTPGYADFVGEMSAGLGVAEAAILVIGADTGVTPALENIWDFLAERKVPTAIFLNKLDKDNIAIDQIIDTIRERLSKHIDPITVPNATGAKLSSVITLLDDGVPPEYQAMHDLMVEDISAGDDKLTEEFLEGKEITPDELRTSMRNEFKDRQVFPMLCGSATKNIGVRELADFIAGYFPAPQVSDSGNFSALVYKTVSEPGTGQLNYVKVLSGTATPGKDVYNFNRQLRERIGQMAVVQGKKRIDITEAHAGDLVALLKLKDTRTNDIIGDEKSAPPNVHISFPATIYDRAIRTHSKGDDEKVGTAMAILAVENPTIRHFFNPETREVTLSGMGALQLEIIAKKLKSRYGVDIELHAPRIPYKETVHGKAEVQGKYKRQSGGRGQYGDCWLRIERLERGKGFEFENKIVGGVIPRNYVPAIEKGVREAMEQGVIAGYPVVDVKVTVFDGSYHEVDSSDMAFKIAGAMALRKGISDARPALLEPIMDVEVVVPDEYMGSIMGDLNSRRGRIMGMDKAGKREIVKAQVPLSTMFQYATDLRSLTKGSGTFSMKVSHYEEVPPDIANPLIDAYQKSRMAEVEK